MKDESTFWADQTASDIAQARSKFVVATGITPSGEIHIGNLRELLTADAVVRTLRAGKHAVQFTYVADTYDPLRKVYPFLDPGKYSPHVGKPLSEIPCPCDRHASYADHFLAPFLDSLEPLGMKVNVERADRMYKDGRYVRNIIKALSQAGRIQKILQELTGKEADPAWSPFNPICGDCGRMTTTRVTGFDAAREEVAYECDCGSRGAASMRGGGKLTWRVDWPARWEILGVTVEPFGKDHASAGGSYDTGARISREVFEYEPPFPVVYEWISLKGAGDMSSSKGNVISVHEMLKVAPAEVLKYAILKVKPNRSIVFDPGLPLLQLIDEYDDPTSKNRSPRAAELAVVEGAAPTGIPFRHMVSLVQTTQDDPEKILGILKRTGYAVSQRREIEKRIRYARQWLEKFAPDDVKFTLQVKLPASAINLSELQRKALSLLGQRLGPDLTAEQIHSLVYGVKDETGLKPEEIFEAIYQVLLGRPKGPRAGFFLASLDADFVKARFAEAA